MMMCVQSINKNGGRRSKPLVARSKTTNQLAKQVGRKTFTQGLCLCLLKYTHSEVRDTTFMLGKRRVRGRIIFLRKEGGVDSWSSSSARWTCYSQGSVRGNRSLWKEGGKE